MPSSHLVNEHTYEKTSIQTTNDIEVHHYEELKKG